MFYFLQIGSIIALLVGAAILRSMPDYYLPLSIAVCVSAIATAVYAVRLRSYWLAAGLFVVSVVINPVRPTVAPSGTLFNAFLLLAAVLFCLSAYFLRAPRVLSVASITDRTPGSESL